MLIQIAAILFAIAALGGATLASLHFAGKPRPLELSALHGLVALSGIVLLAIGVWRREFLGLALAALFIFILAAMAGLTMLAQHLRKKRLSPFLIAVHAGAAVLGFVLLVMDIMRYSAPAAGE